MGFRNIRIYRKVDAVKCKECGSPMYIKDTYKRGRHHKGLYRCINCGKHIIENMGVIPNNVGRGF